MVAFYQQPRTTLRVFFPGGTYLEAVRGFNQAMEWLTARPGHLERGAHLTIEFRGKRNPLHMFARNADLIPEWRPVILIVL